MDSKQPRGIDELKRARAISTSEDKMLGRAQYINVDSPLGTEFNWQGGAFSRNFCSVIGEERSLKRYIEGVLQKKRGQAIGIEFGGLGINLFKGFSPGFFKQSIGVSLSDHRTDDGQLLYSDGKEVYQDEEQHNIIIGNLFDTKVYKDIEKIIGNKKVDFIIERMWAGLKNVPNNFLVIMTIFQKWYSMLDKGGLMLIETPAFAGEVIKGWVRMLKNEKYAEQVDVEFDEFRMALRIHKLSETPNQLPKLSLKEVEKIINHKS